MILGIQIVRQERPLTFQVSKWCCGSRKWCITQVLDPSVMCHISTLPADTSINRRWYEANEGTQCQCCIASSGHCFHVWSWPMNTSFSAQLWWKIAKPTCLIFLRDQKRSRVSHISLGLFETVWLSLYFAKLITWESVENMTTVIYTWQGRFWCTSVWMPWKVHKNSLHTEGWVHLVQRERRWNSSK